MEEHIIALLKNNLRVIIPDFGAFIVRQKEPEIIVFNEFLRYNDGLLIDYITKTEQLDKEIAEQKVTDFAEESTKILESGKTLEIKGLGSLSRDPSGKINFTEESAQSGKAKPGVKREISDKAHKKILRGGISESSGGDRVKQGNVSVPSASGNSDSKDAQQVEEKQSDGTIRKSQNGESEVRSPDQKQDKPDVQKTSRPLGKKDADAKPDEKRDAGVRAEEEPGVRVKPEEESEGKASDMAATATEKEDQDGPGTGSDIQPEGAPKRAFEKAGMANPPTVSGHKAESKEGKDEKTGRSTIEVPSPTTQSERKTYGAIKAKPLPTPTAKKSSTINQILTWIGIFLVANIIVLAWFLYRDQITGFFTRGKSTEILMDSIAVEEEAEPLFKPVAEDTAPATGEVPLVEQPAISSIQTARPKYYIVAGCFREETNADALVQSLRSRGYEAEEFGNIGNLHAVSYASFDNQADALKELERIRQEEQPEAWMTRF